jgi:carboxymethylenebutenolidase
MFKFRLLMLAVAAFGLAACEGAGSIAAPTEAGTAIEPFPTAAAEQVATETPEPAAGVEDSIPEAAALPLRSEDVDIASGGQIYPSYLSAPADGGPYPAVILLHSINGMEEGYRTLSDRLAAEGFVVLTLGWQTFERNPPDVTVQQLLTDSITYLSSLSEVDPDRLGLTGFCIGGYYTMLFLPQFSDFKAGVAWYGFPYRGSPQPADLIADLEAPMLIIHGTADNPSPIADIYRYTDALTGAGKTFDLKVYEGEPHGFMLSGGQVREDQVTTDAFHAMLDYFRRYL